MINSSIVIGDIKPKITEIIACNDLFLMLQTAVVDNAITNEITVDIP